MKKFAKITGYVLLLGVITGSIWALNNRQTIEDWWYLRNYQPSAEIEQLAVDSGLSNKGRDLFYIADPTKNDKFSFNVNCPFEEKTIVLGCYDGENIFILEIDDAQLEGVEIVTAAHEMLHVAYERLSNEDKERITELLRTEFENSTNERVKDIVGEYDNSDQLLINNELHSILPTELESLSAELEEYYSQYFDNRQLVVSAAKAYESVFVAISEEIDILRAEIEVLQAEINQAESQLSQFASQINDERAELDSLLANDQIEEYNSRVPGFNTLIGQHNGLIESIRSSVSAHNLKVEELNSKALQHNELINTIDSNYQPI